MFNVRLRNNTFPLFLSLTFISILIPLEMLFAHDEKPKVAANKAKKTNWGGGFSLGLTSNVGNTNTGILRASARAVHNPKFNAERPLRHTLNASVNLSDRSAGRGKDRIDTKDQKRAGYRVGYFISDRKSLRALINYQTDNLAKLDSLVYTAVGYQQTLFETKRHKFAVGGGVGYLDVEYTDGTAEVSGAAGRLAFDYTGSLTKNIKLTSKIAVMGKSGFTQQLAVTRLEYAFNDNSSIALDHEIEHYIEAPLTALDNTDSSTSLKFVYKF